jgi:hypothetical protein
MRRRRSDAYRCVIRRQLLTCCLLLGVARAAAAQTVSTDVGGLDFLLPVGARAVAMGQTLTAATGSDALWANPAGIAHGPREVALHMATNSSPLAETDASGAVVYPVHRLGAFALSVHYLNYGQQGSTVDQSGQIGSFVSTSTTLAGTFAPILTDRLTGGITGKLLRIGFNCTGSCDKPENVPQTAALDFGLQYLATKDSTLTIGASVRNLGPKLQVNDSPQSDPLPELASIGLAYAPKLAQLPKEARVRLGADAVANVIGGGDPGFRIGGELSWMEKYEVRAGYVATGPTGSGPTFGLGISTGKLQIDLAQMISDVAASGSTPTFLTLRYIF